MVTLLNYRYLWLIAMFLGVGCGSEEDVCEEHKTCLDDRTLQITNTGEGRCPFSSHMQTCDSSLGEYCRCLDELLPNGDYNCDCRLR